MIARIASLILVSAFCVPAYAYVDPGNGSMILQSLMAIGVFVAATISMSWNYIKDRLKNLFGKREKHYADADDKEE